MSEEIESVCESNKEERVNEMLDALQSGLQCLTEGEGIWEDRVKLRRFNAEIEAIRTIIEWICSPAPEEDLSSDISDNKADVLPNAIHDAKVAAFGAIERFCNGIGVN